MSEYPAVNKNTGPLDHAMAVLGKVQNIISITCFVLMSIFVLTGVAMRFVFKIPFTWGEEISRYLMVCGVLIGISMGVREKAHLGVTVFIGMMPPKMAKYVSMLGNVITTLAYFVLVYLSYLFITSTYQYGQRSPALDIPMHLVYCVLFLGFLISAIESIIVIYQDLLAKG